MNGYLGGITLLVGMVFGATSFFLLIWSFRRLKEGCLSAPRVLASPISVARAFARVGYGFLAAAALLFPVGFFVKGGSQTPMPLAALLAGAGAAIALLVAVATPVVWLGRGWSVRAAWISIVTGIAAVATETWLVLENPLGVGRGFNWLLFGGYPLINWNLPFGLMVAVTSVLLWWAYRPMRTIARDLRAGRPLHSPRQS